MAGFQFMDGSGFTSSGNSYVAPKSTSSSSKTSSKTSSKSTSTPTNVTVAPMLQYDDLVRAQGGSAVNRQTGAVTTAAGYTAPKVNQDPFGQYAFDGGSMSGNALPSAGDPSYLNQTQVLNQAQQTALDTLKPMPVSDPFALKEQANELIGSEVNSIQSMIQKSQQQMDAITAQVAGYMQQSETEQGLTKKINNLDTSFETGINTIRNEPIPMNLVQGQSAALDRQYDAQRNSLVRQLTAETASREQRLNAAKFLYDATRNRLADTIELMKATAPENIADYTDAKGDMYVVMKNPITGQITKQNVGNTGTSTEKEANKKLALEIGAINSPFYKVGQEIRNTATGEAYPTWEAYLAAGGTADLSNVFQYQEPEAEDKASNYQIVKDTESGVSYRVDRRTGESTPLDFNSAGSSKPSNSIGAALQAKYPEGSTGPGSGEYIGQCGVFTQSAVNGVPQMGNTVDTKKAMIDSQGMRAAQWKQAPQVGDVLIFTVGSAGHAAVVNTVNSNGTVTLSESNWKGDKKVTHSRTIPITDGSIYGAWRSQSGPPNPANIKPATTSFRGPAAKPVTEAQEFTDVKRIVAMYPKEWGMAADAIDAKYGAGTATKYDAYLKDKYADKPSTTKSSSSNPYR